MLWFDNSEIVIEDVSNAFIILSSFLGSTEVVHTGRAPKRMETLLSDTILGITYVLRVLQCLRKQGAPHLLTGSMAHRTNTICGFARWHMLVPWCSHLTVNQTGGNSWNTMEVPVQREFFMFQTTQKKLRGSHSQSTHKKKDRGRSAFIPPCHDESLLSR